MDDNYRNNDFEEYVKEHADQFRMFPSEKVWNGVHRALHQRRKWYGVGLAFLLLMTGGAVTWVMNSYPVSRIQEIAKIRKPVVLPVTEDAAQASQQDLNDLIPFNKISSVSPDNSTPVVSISSYTDGPAIVLAVPDDVVPDAPVSMPSVADATIYADPVADNAAGSVNVVTMATRIDQDPATASPRNIGIAGEGNPRAPVTEFSLTIVNSRNQQRNGSTVAGNNTPAINQAAKKDGTPFLQLSGLAFATSRNREQAARTPDLVNYLQTIESVTNSYKAPAKHVSWQFFFTPTISYRRLSENKEFSQPLSTDPLTPGTPANYPFASLTDVNNAVTHKPDLGLQVGFAARYPLTRELKLRGGFQFNINRYDIKAFVNNGEVAHIELDGNAANSSVSTWTNYRSQGTARLDWLKNYYLSISAPLGIEVTVLQNKHNTTSLGFAGTIQPTYVIRDRAYLISTDYKNYAQVPWLIRHVNVSTGFETFLNFTRGKTQMQVGPQVRYQLMSSFHNKYPVKENLFDFGLKLGITLNR